MEGAWDVEYVAPDPISVELGISGESLALTRREDGTYETGDGEPFQSGGIWKAANGSDYKLTLVDGEWSYEYVPPSARNRGFGDERRDSAIDKAGRRTLRGER